MNKPITYGHLWIAVCVIFWLAIAYLAGSLFIKWVYSNGYDDGYIQAKNDAIKKLPTCKVGDLDSFHMIYKPTN